MKKFVTFTLLTFLFITSCEKGGTETEDTFPKETLPPEEVRLLLTGGSERYWYGDAGGPNDGGYEFLKFKSDNTGEGGSASDPLLDPETTYWTFNWEYVDGALHTYNMQYLPNVNDGELIGECNTPINIDSNELETDAVEGNCSYYVRGTYVRSSDGM